MKAIFKREFQSFFQNVIGWLFLAANFVIFGLYFYVYNLANGYAYVSYSVSALSFIMLITVPVLTMRILAEDRKNKTDQLIFTAPVSVEQVVFAKYLSMAAIFSINVGIMCLAPLVMRIFGTVPLLEAYVSLFGYWMYGLACIAIGTFASSITESQILSAIITFGLLFLGYMMSGITSAVFSTGNILTKILNCYDLIGPMDNFTSGTFDVAGLVYYLSIIVLFLFLTVQVIQKRRWSMSSKKIGLGIFSTGMIVFMVAAVVVVNLIVTALPANITSIDVTEEKLFSLTDDTKELLSELDQDITIYVYAAEDSADQTVAKTLDQYKAVSSHITVKYVDPAVSPKFYENYTDEEGVNSGTLFVESESRSKVIDASSLYETSIDYSSYTQSTTGYDAEGQITSAIQYVTKEDMPVLYEIAGHNETTLTGNFTEAIEKANFTTESLTLLETDEIPEDAGAIIINGPQTDFSEDDANKVKEYLNNGGKAFITTTYTTEDMTNFLSILSEFDLSVADGIVMEGSSSNMYQLPYYLLPNIESASETSGVSGGYVIAPAAQGIICPEETSSDITLTKLLTTSDSAYAKTDISNMQTYEKEEGDTDGPFAIGVKAVKTLEEGSAEIYVFSTPGMFADDADSVVSKNNSTLFSDCITSLVDAEDESAVVIPVKEYSSASITVSDSVLIVSRLLLLFVIPLAVLITGIVIWAVRRKK